VGTRNERTGEVVLLVVDVTPTMSDAQIGAAFEHWLGRGPRLADIAVCNILGRSPASVAEFIWDHGLGEPIQPSPFEIRDWLLEHWRAVG
jgi:hypothetical protein